MRLPRYCVFSLQILVIFTCQLYASDIWQSGRTTVVYFKDGGTVKGKILELVPKGSLRIQTKDGRVFIYHASDIDKIVDDSSSSSSFNPEQGQRAEQIFLSVGVSFPTVDFSSTDGPTAGFATTGLTVGVHYRVLIDDSFLWTFSFSGSLHPIGKSALRLALNIPRTVNSDVSSYIILTAMPGLGFYAPISSDIVFSLVGQAGLMMANTPNIAFYSDTGSLFQASATAFSFAYGAQASVTFDQDVTLSIRYFSGRPTFLLRVVSGGSSFGGDSEQPTAAYQILLGLGI